MDYQYVLARLIPGVQTTLAVALCASALAIVVAFPVGLGRRSRYRTLRLPAAIFIEFFRGTSVLIQLFWLFYALPAFGITLSPFLVGVTALGLNVGAYGAEVVRGAIGAVPVGQTEAAEALHFSPIQTLRHVVLPGAIVPMIPPMTNLFIGLVKGTSLVSLITLSDATSEAMRIRSFTGYTLEIFAILLAIYFAISTLVSWTGSWLERRLGAYRVGTP